MSLLRSICASLTLASIVCVPLTGCAAAQDKSASSTTKPYMLDTCIVSGEKLGTMGAPVIYSYKGQEIKFCCSGCEDDFKKDPEKFMKKLETAKGPATKPAAAG